MICHLIEHFTIGLAKPIIIFKEIAVPVYMGYHGLLIDHIICAQKVGIAGVVVDDHLIDDRQAISIAFRESLVFHAPAPMRIARRKSTVCGNFIQLLIVYQFKDGIKEVKASCSCCICQPRGDLLKFRRQFGIITMHRLICLCQETF